MWHITNQIWPDEFNYSSPGIIVSINLYQSKTPRHKTDKPSIYNSLAADTKATQKIPKWIPSWPKHHQFEKIWIQHHQVWKYQIYIVLYTQNLLFYPKLEQTLLNINFNAHIPIHYFYIWLLNLCLKGTG